MLRKKAHIFWAALSLAGAAQAQSPADSLYPGAPVSGLSSYVNRALQNSPLLKDYRNQVLAGQVDSQLIKAGYRPQVVGNSTNIYAPTINGWGYDNAISNGGNF